MDHAAIVNNCISCHDGISASGKGPAHINSSDQCELCHEKFPATWTPVAPAAVDHTQVNGTCFSCHNGTLASGKSATHINSTNTCEACHQAGPIPWMPVVVADVDHTHVVGSCISCHDGLIASGKSATHISSSDACDACHQPGPVPWIPVANNAVDHAQLTGTCISCHDGLIASGKSPAHINSSDSCEACHQTAPAPWLPVAVADVDHAHVIGTCDSCHNSIVASGKSSNHIASSDACDACHQPGPVPWLPVASADVDHTQVVGSCLSCHDGVVAGGKGANHISSSDVCDACHQPGPAPWLPVAVSAVDHVQVIGACVSCHDGVIASGRGINHINTTDVCDACHQAGPVPWVPVLPSAVDHVQVVGVCSACHNSVVASGKHAQHLITTQECDSCHSVSAWIPASVDHSTFFGNCTVCHDGVSASGKGPTHINSSDACDACHEKFPAAWVPLAPAAVDHGQVVGNCFDCHNGTIASGKSVSHINSSDNCDVCHQAGPTPWQPVAASAVDHAQVNGSCFSCHNGTVASGKSVNHINTSDACDACHQPGPTPWIPVAAAAVDHANVVGACASCHDGNVATGKGVNHITTTDVCEACHQAAPIPWVPLAPAAVDHAQVTGACGSCHNGSVAGGKGPTHINTSEVCEACHQAAPTPWIPVLPAAVDHNQVIGVCSSCHNGSIATGKHLLHVPTNEECDLCHSSQQWLPAAVDHATIVTNCVSCHNGNNASGKGPAHINSSDQCELCHEKFPAAWVPVAATAVDHSQVVGTCFSCHNGTIASGKSAVHINSSNTCEACHVPAPSPWVPVTANLVDHGHVLGSCISCHDGTTASGKSLNHINSSDVCDACHQQGPMPWTPVAVAAVDHTQVTGVCAVCHD